MIYSHNSIHDTQGTPIAETPIETDLQRSQFDSKTNPDINPNPEPDINMELYSAGWFDGLMGYSPELPHLKDYWDAYQIGYREYCCGLLNVEIPESEILEYRADLLHVA